MKPKFKTLLVNVLSVWNLSNEKHSANDVCVQDTIAVQLIYQFEDWSQHFIKELTLQSPVSLKENKKMLLQMGEHRIKLPAEAASGWRYEEHHEERISCLLGYHRLNIPSWDTGIRRLSESVTRG